MPTNLWHTTPGPARSPQLLLYRAPSRRNSSASGPCLEYSTAQRSPFSASRRESPLNTARSTVTRAWAPLEERCTATKSAAHARGSALTLPTSQRSLQTTVTHFMSFVTRTHPPQPLQGRHLLESCLQRQALEVRPQPHSNHHHQPVCHLPRQRRHQDHVP